VIQGDDQSFVFQQSQGLAEGRPADVQMSRQALLDQALAWLKLSGEDALADRVDGQIYQAGGVKPGWPIDATH